MGRADRDGTQPGGAEARLTELKPSGASRPPPLGLSLFPGCSCWEGTGLSHKAVANGLGQVQVRWHHATFPVAMTTDIAASPAPPQARGLQGPAVVQLVGAGRRACPGNPGGLPRRGRERVFQAGEQGAPLPGLPERRAPGTAAARHGFLTGRSLGWLGSSLRARLRHCGCNDLTGKFRRGTLALPRQLDGW